MFIVKDVRKIPEILTSDPAAVTELKLSRRPAEFKQRPANFILPPAPPSTSSKVASKKNTADPGTLHALISHDLSPLTSLEYLSVYDSEIVSLLGIEKLSAIDNLKELHVGCNPISSIPMGLALLELLVSFSADDCLLTTFPTAVSSLPLLQELRLSGNDISEIKAEDLANLTELRGLIMDNNGIATFPLVTLPSLTKLSLRSNSLSSIPSTLFLTSPNLTFVALSSNCLTSIDLPNLVRSCVGLTHVYLNGNVIKGKVDGIEDTAADNILTGVGTALRERGAVAFHLNLSNNPLVIREAPNDLVEFVGSVKKGVMGEGSLKCMFVGCGFAEDVEMMDQ